MTSETLVLAMACDDGVVIGADSANSDVDSGIKLTTEKIKQIKNSPILYGGSGDVGLLQKIQDGLGSWTPPLSMKRIRQELKKIIVPELHESAMLHAPYPALGFNAPPVAIMLFAGVCNRIPWILEIEKDGRDTFYGKEMGNFAAIGSGKPLAQALFRPHLTRE